MDFLNGPRRFRLDFLVKNRDGISTKHLVQGNLNRFSQSNVFFFLNFLNQVHQYLGIGIGLENIASLINSSFSGA